MDQRRIQKAWLLLLAPVLLWVGLSLLFAMAGHSSYSCAQDCGPCVQLAKFQEVLQVAAGAVTPGAGLALVLLLSAVAALFLEQSAWTPVAWKTRMNN